VLAQVHLPKRSPVETVGRQALQAPLDALLDRDFKEALTRPGALVVGIHPIAEMRQPNDDDVESDRT
jgi:hypothetical protein